MARRCGCSRILDMLADPRLLTLPLAAQAVWIRLVTVMERHGISVLRFGSEIQNPREVAMMACIPETELEPNLALLIGRGLMERDGDGAVMCPLLAQAQKRANINRINGLKGGRPRKNAAPDGQRNMLLPIAGGEAAETEITKLEPIMENPRGRATAACTESEKVRSSRAVSDAEFARAGELAMEAAGFDPARWMGDYGIVRQWLADGADAELIVEVIKRRTHPNVVTLRYFSAAVAEELARRRAVPAPNLRYRSAYDTWQMMGAVGDPPRLKDFQDAAA